MSETISALAPTRGGAVAETPLKPAGKRESGPAGPGKASRLSEEEKREVEDLKKRDREVRQHEQAHVAAAGGHSRGGPQYTYTRGPDGRAYATEGHVDIDVSPVPDNPQATVQKAQTVRRAATAPADPSAADRAVAAAASQMEAEARREMAEESRTSRLGGYSALPAQPGGQVDVFG